MTRSAQAAFCVALAVGSWSCSAASGTNEQVGAPQTAAATTPLPVPPGSPAATLTTQEVAPVATVPEGTPAPTTSVAPIPTATPVPTVPVNTDPLGPFLALGYEKAVPLRSPIEAVGRTSGSSTTVVQQRLLDLGFWVSGVDGDYGLTTTQAVMAFQKYFAIEASGVVDEATAQAMNEVELKVKASVNEGDVIEIDKTRQLLFIVTGGTTKWALNVSTGNGQEYEEEDQNSPGEIVRGVSLTPDGKHKVYKERPEGWWEGDLGKIYRPKYFVGGVAVHGSGKIPNYPASHGCVRVSTVAMDWIWEQNFMPLGTRVYVHGGDNWLTDTSAG